MSAAGTRGAAGVFHGRQTCAARRSISGDNRGADGGLDGRIRMAGGGLQPSPKARRMAVTLAEGNPRTRWLGESGQSQASGGEKRAKEQNVSAAGVLFDDEIGVLLSWRGKGRELQWGGRWKESGEEASKTLRDTTLGRADLVVMIRSGWHGT